jgi:5-methylcytosine-specific restriction endonuclease McrA
MSGDPYPKSKQLARGERRHTRQIASKKRWMQIADAKQDECRVCLTPPPNELHHLVPRGRGGADTESNIVPLCQECHRLITARRRDVCAKLRRRLDDAEYAYVVDKLGENGIESLYPVTYLPAA